MSDYSIDSFQLTNRHGPLVSTCDYNQVDEEGKGTEHQVCFLSKYGLDHLKEDFGPWGSGLKQDRDD